MSNKVARLKKQFVRQMFFYDKNNFLIHIGDLSIIIIIFTMLD